MFKRFVIAAKAALYTTFALIIVGAGIVYASPIVQSMFVSCCSYGVDCARPGDPAGDLVCCYPAGGQAPCSPDRENYCVGSCS